MKQIIQAAVLICAAASAPTLLYAAEFSVTPIRIFMTPRERAVAITVTNEGDKEVVMQADLYLWKQKPGGEDELTLTEDMILSPPIIRLAGNSRQVVRLARLSAAPAGAEQTYRMIVREIPEARPASSEVALQVALAFSMPVFITPPGAKRQLVCGTERVTPTAVKVNCENKGTAYAQVRSIALMSANGDKLAGRDTGAYILPEINRSFELTRAEGAIPGGNVRLQVGLDDGSTQSFDGSLAD